MLALYLPLSPNETVHPASIQPNAAINATELPTLAIRFSISLFTNRGVESLMIDKKKVLACAALLSLLPLAASAATTTIPVGTQINATLDTPINSGTANVGDSFTAHVQSPYPYGDPSFTNAVITGEIVQVQRAGQGRKPGVALQFTTIQLYDGSTAPIDGYLVTSQQRSQQKSGARVVATTIGGMLVGNALGKLIFGSSSRMGGWVGGLGGFLVGQNYQANIEIPQGSQMLIALRRQLVIRRQAGY